jgi:hypothetical protein
MTFAQRKHLQIRASLAVQISEVLHSFPPWGSQSPACNKTAITFRGKRYDLGMIDDVLISRSSNLTGFDRRKLDPLAFQLSLDGFFCVVSARVISAPVM